MLPGQIAQRNISSGAQRDSKPKLHDFLLYINVIISHSFSLEKCLQWVTPSLFIISSTATMIGWTIPRGILFQFRPGYVRLAEPYHVVPFKSSAALKHRIWVNILSFLNSMQTPICYVGCLIIANTWIYISL